MAGRHQDGRTTAAGLSRDRQGCGRARCRSRPELSWPRITWASSTVVVPISSGRAESVPATRSTGQVLSPAANSNTSWPAATRPRANRSTTASVPPYDGGGTGNHGGASRPTFTTFRGGLHASARACRCNRARGRWPHSPCSSGWQCDRGRQPDDRSYNAPVTDARSAQPTASGGAAKQIRCS